MRLEPLVKLRATMRPVPLGATPAGTRLNMELQGTSEPDGRLQGRLEGVDYLTIRSDGVMELNVQATLTTDGGEKVSVSGQGLAVPAPEGGMAGRLALRFGTAAGALSWLNRVVGFATTRADMQTGHLEMAVATLEE